MITSLLEELLELELELLFDALSILLLEELLLETIVVETLSELFKVSDDVEGAVKRDPIFANYYKDDNGKFVLNTGLLDNNMIPSFDDDTKMTMPENQKEEE